MRRVRTHGENPLSDLLDRCDLWDCEEDLAALRARATAAVHEQLHTVVGFAILAVQRAQVLRRDWERRVTSRS